MRNIRSYKGYTPSLCSRVYIDEAACVIGRVTLAEDVGVWPGTIIRGDVNHISIGPRSNVQDGAVLHVTRTSEQLPEGYALLIGSDVTIGHKAMLHGCQIGDRVLVGMGAILLDGAIIEDDVMIAAGTLVPPKKRLLSGYLYMGNPARQHRELSPEEKSSLLRSAHNYVLLKDEYLAELP